MYEIDETFDTSMFCGNGNGTHISNMKYKKLALSFRQEAMIEAQLAKYWQIFFFDFGVS